MSNVNLVLLRLLLVVVAAGRLVAGEPRAEPDPAPHWSLQPVPTLRVLGETLPPSTETGSAIDGYLRARLGEEGLEGNGRATPHQQIRRLCLMLTGLPPEPEDVRAFAADASTEHYVRLVDRYLQSPRFGERWARHWMDVVRYAETWGYEWNHLIRGAWRYRDYLIRAFNEDLPYDQFVREHIAGDLLEQPRENKRLGINESLIAGAFYRFGETGHDDCVLYSEISLDVMDNQIDTLSKSFQALTVSCARCHDHKLDAIPQRDYYAMLGVMASSRQVIRTLDLPGRQSARRKTLAPLKESIRRELATLWTRAAEGLSAEALQGLAEETSAGGPSRDRWEDPLYAWRELNNGAETSDESAAEKALREEHQRRLAFNQSHFEILGDLTKGREGVRGWGMEGLAVTDAFSGHGGFSVLPSGPEAIDGVLPAGFYTHGISQKLNAALRSPWLPEGKRFVSYEVMGARGSVCRTVIANCTLPYFHTHRLNAPRLSWTRLGLEHLRTSPLVRLKTYLEWATVLDDQGYPVLNMPQVEYHQTLADPRSYFGLTRVVAHDIEETPRQELGAQLLFFEGDAPLASRKALAARYGEVLTEAVRRWGEDAAEATDVYWINAFIDLKLLRCSRDGSERLRQLVDRYRSLEDELESPRRIVGMADQDGAGFDVPLFSGGEVTSPREDVHRGYLTVMNSLTEAAAPTASEGSGRRRMAELIAHPENPLTARVMVNRLWHYLFGQGLVRSVDDFGRLGDRPSHPQLLDALARRFIDSGWSVKGMIREIVLSEAFRQSSVVEASADSIDPENHLLHRYPSRRLEAEVIRDSMLWASGRLDEKMEGLSINPFRDADVDRRKLYAGPLDGEGRRSLYLKVTRMGPPKLLELFNFPAPSMTRGRRDVTNVPAQALGMFNHPFVHQQAEVKARQMVRRAATGQSQDSLFDELSWELFSRPAATDERAEYPSFFAELAALHAIDSASAPQSLEVWKDFVHMLFRLKEFTYVL